MIMYLCGTLTPYTLTACCVVIAITSLLNYYWSKIVLFTEKAKATG